MAAEVCRAFEKKAHLFVEAGTGVGKSFAYLVPAMLRAMLRNETVVVSTHTIALQEQLINKDIPLLAAALEEAVQGELRDLVKEEMGIDVREMEARPIKAVLVKGRGNYVSIRRLALASQRADRLLADAAGRRSLAVIQEWATTTLDGTRSTLPPLERERVWTHVESDSGNCMGRKCRNYDACFYQNARREADSANVLVTNHALFFSDLALRVQEKGFLPEYHQVVLDEAHSVEDVASQYFGAELSERRVLFLLNTLYAVKSGKGYLPQLSMNLGDATVVDRACQRVLEAEASSRALFDALAEMLRSGKTVSGRLTSPVEIENPLTPALNDLALTLKNLQSKVSLEADQFELNSYAERAAALAVTADAVLKQQIDGCAYWIEQADVDDGARHAAVTLACAPIEVAPLLRENLFDQKFGVVLTSATLATATQMEERAKSRDSRRVVSEAEEDAEQIRKPAKVSDPFAHVIARLGGEGASTLQLDSPFDYSRQVSLVLDMTVGDPPVGGGRGGAEFSARMAERILFHLKATEGGAFVLFTAYRSLFDAADQLSPRLRELWYPLLVQGRDGERSQLLERFRNTERSVLFGAASFWQGVDVRGDRLRNVIITRLPFDRPDEPLVAARTERITEMGGNAFADDSLPRAIIRFKQGFGRLIRSATDMGQVVVLDPRIVSKPYGKRFLGALPPGVKAQILRPEPVQNEYQGE
jgi:ATP-dependent DNA helicase DinG